MGADLLTKALPRAQHVGIWDFTCERSVLRLSEAGIIGACARFAESDCRRRSGATSCAPVYGSATDAHSHSHLYLSVTQIVNMK